MSREKIVIEFEFGSLTEDLIIDFRIFSPQLEYLS